ncbi:protein translocase subunit SecF [Olegusella massiliensis]|uniref:protein translocase subunit SecF n=1 Tax=Olegusella massiliensis TaxID=1776381 RepID=UPI0028EE056E|nr:protein translocase subunit SecF [Olegusella massiliensis]
MRSHFASEINFMGHRFQLLTFSGILIVLSIVGLIVRGLVFGIEFRGGTEIDFQNTGDISIAQMRSALEATGEQNLTIQTAVTEGEKGFLVRSDATNPTDATAHAAAAAESLKLPKSSYTVTTIGPDWGADTVRSSSIAFLVSLVAIIAFVSIRYEFKMSITAVASLVHDLVIILGVYAWTQTPITPNVVAALLTVMGYSLYDTVVEFNRINENAKRGGDANHRTYFQITNYSINEVIVRTINTTITTIVPIIVMYAIGGTTLRDFAFAMLIGELLGTYSSFAIASPLLAIWKTNEPKWHKLEERYGGAGAAVRIVQQNERGAAHSFAKRGL